MRVNLLHIFVGVNKGLKDRDVAARIISMRNEDKQAGIVTEKYSGLRLKYVCVYVVCVVCVGTPRSLLMCAHLCV